MFDRFYNPVVELQNQVLVRRSGLFHRRTVHLHEVERIVATNNDALTHEELVIWFFDAHGPRLWISEFDTDFAIMMEDLIRHFPECVAPVDVVGDMPFEKVQTVLWQKTKTRK